MKVRALLISAIKQLNNEEASLEAQIFLQHTLNVNHAWLIAHADDEINVKDHHVFQALLQRRLRGEPIAYILGEREFYGLTLKTTPDTLIPRPDTETLVDAALEKIAATSKASMLDLGTGSGAIALAIAKHRPQTQVTAVDFSKGALTVAKENAESLNLSNVSFEQSNWYDALQNQTFDLIVSNPPYIEDNDPHLRQGDLRFEPSSALASGSDGLDDIRHIVAHAARHLNPDGWLLLEHGYNQSENVASLLKRAEFKQIQHVKDLAGIHRVTMGCVSK